MTQCNFTIFVHFIHYFCQVQKESPLSNIPFDTIKFVPGHSVDCVIIAFDRDGLKVLVMKWKGPEMFCLPGGFILVEEDLDKAAIRVLKERAGIELPFLVCSRTIRDGLIPFRCPGGHNDCSIEKGKIAERR